MLGILLIYFIGKSFFTLAEIHNKSKWTFAIVGIAVYYAGTIAGGILVGLIILYLDPYSELSDIIYGLIGIPFGLLSWWGLYALLKKQWSNNKVSKNHDILDDGLLDD